MSKKTNWKNVEKSNKALLRKIKNMSGLSEYLSDKPQDGYFKDNISKNIIKISDAKSSSLRRYIKLLDDYYYIVTSTEDRNYLLNKKIEIETELNGRDDANVKK
jgi:hypothetical protein